MEKANSRLSKMRKPFLTFLFSLCLSLASSAHANHSEETLDFFSKLASTLSFEKSNALSNLKVYKARNQEFITLARHRALRAEQKRIMLNRLIDESTKSRNDAYTFFPDFILENLDAEMISLRKKVNALRFEEAALIVQKVQIEIVEKMGNLLENS